MCEDTCATVLVLGGLPRDYLQDWQITSDIGLAVSRLGVHVQEVPASEVDQCVSALGPRGLAEAADVAEQLLAGARSPGEGAPARDVVKGCAKLYVAVKRLTERNGALAVTVNCGAWKSKADRALPCVALMLLQEGGLPAVCQGDMDALLTTILFHRGEAHPTYIGGPHGTDNGMLDVSHCVLPRTMSGLHTPPQDYYLADYHGSGEGCTVHTSLPTGKRVTVGRLMQGLGVLLLDGGTVQGTMDREDRCRNTVYVQMDSGTALLDRLKGHQQHVVVACGDHLDTVAARARERDIRVEHLSGR